MLHGTSFGYCKTYSTLSMYYQKDESKLQEEYYAYPSAGNFPSEEMYTNETWHLYIVGNVYGSFNISFIYNGKEYKAEGISVESGYPAIDFKLPAELIKQLGGNEKRIPDGTSIEVKIEGLHNDVYDNINYDYTVNFFTTKDIQIGDVDADGEITLQDYAKILSYVKGTQTLTEQEKKRADVDRDEEITLQDYSQVLAHVKGIKFLQQK